MRHRLPFVALCVFASSPAVALDLPARKTGLWEIKMTLEGPGIPPQTMQQCVDAATDKLMNSFGGGPGHDSCSKQDVQKVGDTIVIDSVCQTGPVSTTSHGVITGDFNSAYTMKMTSRRAGGPAIPGVPADGAFEMTLDAKWLGACKAGQQPGDIVMPGANKNMRGIQGIPTLPEGHPPVAPRKKN